MSLAGTQNLVYRSDNLPHTALRHLDQWFSKWGPGTPGGPWHMAKGSAKKKLIKLLHKKKCIKHAFEIITHRSFYHNISI